MATRRSAKGKSGRPTKLTDTLTKKVTAALEEGCRIEDACLVAGISTRTFRLWREKGRKGESPYVEFFEACDLASAKARIKFLKKLKDGVNIKGEEDWKAIDRMMSRLYPELAVAEVTRRAIDMEVEQLFVAMESHLKPEERAAMYAAYAKVRGIQP